MKYKVGDKIVIKEQSEMGWMLLGHEDRDEEKFIESVDRILTIKEIRYEEYVPGGFPGDFYIVEEMHTKVLQHYNNGKSELVEVYERIYEPMVKCLLYEYKEKHYIKSRFDILDL